MKTIELTQADMGKRVARFKDLAPLGSQSNGEVPLETLDIIYARKVLSVIGLAEGETAVSQGALIKGAGGMAMGIGVCPPGQGPTLHAHHKTYETFTVLRGRFEVRWNDDGGESLVLEQFDTISIPPGVCRAFRNVGEEEGLLQAIITGGVHDMQDIAFSRVVGEQLAAENPKALDYFKTVGFEFNASREDA